MPLPRFFFFFNLLHILFLNFGNILVGYKILNTYDDTKTKVFLPLRSPLLAASVFLRENLHRIKQKKAQLVLLLMEMIADK